MKFVVPGASLREIERILGDDDDIVEIFPDSKNILFRIGGTTLITRLIDGEFLNYRAAIPKEFEHEVSAAPRYRPSSSMWSRPTGMS